MSRIALENVTVSYRRHPAVHHVSCAFNQGEAWAVFGPNGAGKSTLLKAMMRLVRCDTGHVRWENLQRRDIAYLPQASEIDRSLPMSVQELVATGLWFEMGLFRGITSGQKNRVDAALERVGLENMGERAISALSNGQFQRVLFARMLAQQARFLLLDEPFAAVDAVTTFALLDVLQGCLKEDKAIIVVVHDFEQVEAYFPKTLLISREKIAEGPTRQVLTETNLQAAQAMPHSARSDEWCLVENASGSLKGAGHD